MRTTKRQAADSIKEQAAVITGIEDTATVSEENQKFLTSSRATLPVSHWKNLQRRT